MMVFIFISSGQCVGLHIFNLKSDIRLIPVPVTIQLSQANLRDFL